MANSIPNILIIDDREEQTALQLELSTRKIANSKKLHPNDIELKDLLDAQLVLVDYQLDNWDEREKVESLSLRPSDGLALAGILRRYAHASEAASPTAFAIHTGKIDKLASPLPAEHREHALARICNVEWVFQKATPGRETDLAAQVGELAGAIQKLPKLWGSGNADDRLEQLAELLEIGKSEQVRSELLEDVEACLPPLHELSEWSHGLAVLRWLLHRILPYPCFLWSSHYLAARFRIDHAALREALQENAELRNALGPCEYRGLLGSFLGPRWWRSRIEAFLWEITKGASADTNVVRSALSQIAKKELPVSSPPNHPVVCLNSQYQPIETFASVEEAIRLRPDDWPPYADQAWTTPELAKSEPKLRALVMREDRERVGLK